MFYPIPSNPTFITHAPKKRNYTNVLSNLKVDYFKADIYSNGLEHKNAQVKEITENVKMVMVETNLYGNYEKKKYQISNLKVGDELVVEYSYGVDYDQNYLEFSSFRIFLHGKVHKNKYSLTLIHNSDLDINLNYENNGQPSDSIIGKDITRYRWIKNNLDGCIDELGAKPYLNLPYIVFSLRPVALKYYAPNSFESKHIPIYALYAYQREQDHLGILKGIYHDVKLKQYNLLNSYVKSEIENIKDSTGYLHLKKLHNKIVDDFNFDSDTIYFDEEDIRKPRMGEYLFKNTIRDISRYNTYVALISKLNLQYYTSYICDNRSGIIGNNYFKPMYQSDYFFAVVLNNNSLVYLYPKKSKFGHYLNELPFYYENTYSMLVYIDDYMNFKKSIQEENRYKKMPTSNLKDNTRTNSILAKANLDSLKINFRGRINLSGQYSTMTRGLYLHDYKDPTINDCYNKKIWEINKNVNLKSKNTTVQKKVFPFSTKVDMQFSCNNLISKKDDKYILDLSNWFNHIIYKDINVGNRKLDFYADFKGSDSYTYNIQFDKNIELLNSLENDTITNEFGEYILNVTQPAGNVVKITSLFITKNTKVKADNINFAQSIYDKIIALNKSSLEFKIE